MRTEKQPQAHDDDLSVSAEIRKEIAVRIGALIAGSTQRAFAQRVGVSQTTINQYLQGQQDPRLSQLVKIAEGAGRSLAWLVTGVEAGAPATVDKADGFVPVPRLQVKASAGAGAVAVPEDLEDEGVVMFREAWMRRIGVNPRTAQALTAIGDSMEPTIRDGDLLLVDRSIDRIVDNGIYVVVLGGMVLVKRVQVKRDGSILLRSDNTDLYEAEQVPPDEVNALMVEGRVRWFGRTI